MRRRTPPRSRFFPVLAEPLYGTILDVSRSGLRLAIPTRISRGEHVKIKLHRNVIFGEVRYCRAVRGGFQAGLKIQDLVRPFGKQDEHMQTMRFRSTQSEKDFRWPR